MAFKYILTPEEIREKKFNFVKPTYSGTLDVASYTTNWIFGLYDDETGVFFSLVYYFDYSKAKYFLCTKNGECYYFVSGRAHHNIIEIPDEIKHYSESIQSALKTYANDAAKEEFWNSFSNEEGEELLKIKYRMIDRSKRSEEINCFEDAKRLLIKEEYFNNKINELYNEDTVERFHKHMPEDMRRFLTGERFRELMRDILSYGDSITEEELVAMSKVYHTASFVYSRRVDDLCVDLVFEALKKGNDLGIRTGGFQQFIECYLKFSWKFFPDKIIELKPIIDYMNEYMPKNNVAVLEYYRLELDRRINNRDDGYRFVFSTDEVRDTLFEMFKDTDMINSPFFNWSTGIYDKDAGIFMTMIYRNPPGREVFERLYKYVVMKDGEEPFIVYADNEYRTGEWFYDIPARYEYLSDKIKEGVALSQFDSEFRLNLSKEDNEKYIKATIAKMKKRVEEYKSCR